MPLAPSLPPENVPLPTKPGAVLEPAVAEKKYDGPRSALLPLLMAAARFCQKALPAPPMLSKDSAEKPPTCSVTFHESAPGTEFEPGVRFQMALLPVVPVNLFVMVAPVDAAAPPLNVAPDSVIAVEDFANASALPAVPVVAAVKFSFET